MTIDELMDSLKVIKDIGLGTCEIAIRTKSCFEIPEIKIEPHPRLNVFVITFEHKNESARIKNNT